MEVFVQEMGVKIIGNITAVIIHSLWQGLVLASIAALVMAFTARSTAVKRYNLLVLTLALFVISTIITAVFQFSTSASAAVSYLQLVPHRIREILPVNLVSYRSFAELTQNIIHRYSIWISAVWLTIVGLQCLRAVVGIYSLDLIRSRSARQLPAEWTQRLQQLARQVGVSGAVSMAESKLARVPVMIGALKPLILIPAGLLTSLPEKEIECILIHELAHIRRKDYLVNMLQTAVEIVFFFNPAVLWLSSLIRAERENCCDDIVRSHVGDDSTYLRALVACQEYQLVPPRFALAFTSSGTSLLSRVTRILSGRNTTLSFAEKTLAFCSFILAAVLTVFVAGSHGPAAGTTTVTTTVTVTTSFHQTSGTKGE